MRVAMVMLPVVMVVTMRMLVGSLFFEPAF